MYRYRAIVERVVDGDTVDLDVDLGFRTWKLRERFRLSEIDAPETRGETRNAGIAAKAYLQELLPVGAEVDIETYKHPDHYGRWLARIIRDGKVINQMMVETGHAVVSKWSAGD